MSRIDSLIDDIRHLMDDEGRQTLAAIEAEVSYFQDEIENLDVAAYDAGYSEGQADGGMIKDDLIADLALFINGAQIHQQTHGFIAMNGNIFGFGDTASEALADYLRQAVEDIS